MTSIDRTTFSIAALVVLTYMSNEAALAACNATVNGRPMSAQLCALNMQIYGQVLPGDYMMDNNGNWVSVNNPSLHGNIYRDAQGSSTGGYSGKNYRGPFGDYMSDGRCSFVNGIPVGDCN